MQPTLAGREGFFRRWAKQAPLAMVPIIGHLVLSFTALGRHYSSSQLHFRWFVTGAVTSLVVLCLCGVFVYSFKDRIKPLEIPVFTMAGLLTSAAWTCFFVAGDPATKEILPLASSWQWLGLASALLCTFSFLLTVGLLVDRRSQIEKLS